MHGNCLYESFMYTVILNNVRGTLIFCILKPSSCLLHGTDISVLFPLFSYFYCKAIPIGPPHSILSFPEREKATSKTVSMNYFSL